MEKKGPQFLIQRVSDYGTGHPYVARLMYQTMELLKWTTLPEKRKNEVAELYVGLQNRLFKCAEVLGRLKDKFKAALEDAGKEDPNERVRRVPFLTGLDAEAETFLYEVKNYLRDLAKVFNLFYGTSFQQASDWFDPKGSVLGKIQEWTRNKFGADDGFVKALMEDSAWIKELVRKRNAAEHPGGHSGVLVIKNFQLSGEGKFIPPIWFREGEQPTQVLKDLEAYCHNLFTLAEELLVIGCIDKNLNNELVTISEIPESHRREENPQRFTVIMKNK